MRPLVVLLLASIAFGSVHATDAAHRSVEERWVALTTTDLTGYENSNGRALAVERAYRDLFADDATTWRSASSADLDLYFRAASYVAFYSMRASDVERMERIVKTLEERKIAQPRHYVDLYGALISIRSFDQAQALLEAHPGLPVDPLPTIVMEAAGAGPAVWGYSKDRASITLAPATLSQDAQVIVVAHPLCHFTQDAARSINADAQLRAALAGALWLAPQSRNLDVSVIQRWNGEHPTMQIHSVNRRTDWPDLANWGTPTFYFLRDGKVVETVVGWPKEGRRAEILAAAERIRSPKPGTK